MTKLQRQINVERIIFSVCVYGTICHTYKKRKKKEEEEEEGKMEEEEKEEEEKNLNRDFTPSHK